MTPVIAIFDVGKTNKKLFLLDEQYNIVFERSAKFLETVDEDGDACENLESLRLSIFDSLHEVFRKKEFDVKAINFTSYGASLVYLDENVRPLTPLYNYLKPYPKALQQEFYTQYGGAEQFSLDTASPALGSLNSGLQLYRLQQERPTVFAQVKYAVHLPQYLSFVVSGQLYSDMTSIGCHTALWDFVQKDYHRWVTKTGIADKLPPIARGDEVFPAAFPGATYKVGVGLHDSSSALIPYLLNFHEPFVLISTGTWCISLNPYNDEELTKEQLEKDCLFYMTYEGTPVKASRLFAGYEHEVQTKRIAEHFGIPTARFKKVDMDWEITNKLLAEHNFSNDLSEFQRIDLNDFSTYAEAYHAFMIYLINAQVASTKLVLTEATTRIFVDGGFGRNPVFMHLLAKKFEHVEVYAASVSQGTALGAALLIHRHWNRNPVPTDLITLKYYAD